MYELAGARYRYAYYKGKHTKWSCAGKIPATVTQYVIWQQIKETWGYYIKNSSKTQGR